MSPSDLVAVDQQRERWRRARLPLRLLDPESPEFATGGLAQFAPALSVRALILPADPDTTLPPFDEAFWKWWEEPRLDPANGAPTVWGYELRPTAHAAVQYQPSMKEWQRYLALHRHGGIEIGLSRDGMYTRGEERSFRLTTSVGRLWAALELYGSVVERFAVQGPWEISLALRQTKDAYLGEFGSGWSQSEFGRDEAERCREPNLFFRREVMSWPDPDGVRDLAWEFGGWIENAWGGRQRCFLARQGNFAGQLDRAVYNWGW